MKQLKDPESGATLSILDKVSFFDNFTSAQKAELVGAHSLFFVAAAGECVIEEGATDQSLYVLLAGRLSVRQSDCDQPLDFLTPGKLFGEGSFMTDLPRCSSLRAERRSILFEIRRPALEMLPIETADKLKANIVHAMAVRMSEQNQRIATLLRQGTTSLLLNPRR